MIDLTSTHHKVKKTIEEVQRSGKPLRERAKMIREALAELHCRARGEDVPFTDASIRALMCVLAVAWNYTGEASLLEILERWQTTAVDKMLDSLAINPDDEAEVLRFVDGGKRRRK